MRNTLGIVLAAFLFGACAMAASGGYQGRPLAADYDAVSDLTTVLTPVTPGGHPEMTATFSFAGQTQTAPVQQATLRFEDRSETWKYLRSHDLSVLIDGTERHSFAGDHEGDVSPDARVHEVVTVTVPAAVLERMASARTVALRLGPADWTLTAAEIGRLRTLADAMAMRPYAP